MAKQIGIYGGSFDPIHLGHLNLATEMMEIHHLDEVWFCPTGVNPHKQVGCCASADHRAAMVRLAIDERPCWRLLDIELHQSGPSYTLDTLQQLVATQRDQQEPHQFALIIGEDSAHSFYRWHRPEEIIRYARVLVGRRSCESVGTFEGPKEIVEVLERGVTSTRVMEISSTDVRHRLSKRLYCGHLLPSKVVDYILAHDLYSSLLR